MCSGFGWKSLCSSSLGWDHGPCWECVARPRWGLMGFLVPKQPLCMALIKQHTRQKDNTATEKAEGLQPQFPALLHPAINPVPSLPSPHLQQLPAKVRWRKLLKTATNEREIWNRSKHSTGLARHHIQTLTAPGPRRTWSRSWG